MTGYDFLVVITHTEKFSQREKNLIFKLYYILKCNTILMTPKCKNKWYTFIDTKLIINFLFGASLVCKSMNIFISNSSVAFAGSTNVVQVVGMLLSTEGSLSLKRPWVLALGLCCG